MGDTTSPESEKKYSKRTLLDKVIDWALPTRDQKLVRQQFSEPHSILAANVNRRLLIAGTIAATTAAGLGLAAVTTEKPKPIKTASASATDEEKIETTPSIKKQVIDFVLQNYSSSERIEAEALIRQYSEKYRARSDFKDIVFRIQNIYQPMIANSILEVEQRMNTKLNPAVEPLMIGLLIAENDASDTPGGDIGPAQLTDPAIAEAKRIMRNGYSLRENQPQDNITLGLGFLTHCTEIYPSPDLAIWCYNLGRQNIDDLNKAAHMEKGSANVFRLQTNPAADQLLEEYALKTKTTLEMRKAYPWQVIGASTAYLEAQTDSILLSQTTTQSHA
jgi:hypothetical protein